MSYVVKGGSGSPRDLGSVQLQNLVTAADGLGGSLARATISGSHGPTLNTKCNRLYYFLDGRCTVEVGDSRTEVEAGDTVLVPRGTRHGLDGDAVYLVINVPEFDPAAEVAQ